MSSFRYIFPLLTLLATAAADAQYNQSIAVDGTYVPEIIPAERLGLYPQAVRFPMETTPLRYSLRGVPAQFTPQAQPLPASGWNDTRLFSRYPGYLDLGVGSWLNTTLSAGYRFIDTPATEAGVFLQHNSTSLWHPRLAMSCRDRRAWRYDETIGVFASHDFGNAGRLGASLNYHLGNFNYYSWIPSGNTAKNRAADPSQTLNDAALRITWDSPHDRLEWSAAAGVRYFGFRSLYLYTPEGDAPANVTGGRETHARLDGNIGYDIDGSSRIGADLEANVLTYASVKDEPQSFLKAPATYGTVSLTPAYTYSNNGFSLRAGARLDLTMNARDISGERSRTFRAAPDLKIDYSKGAVALFLHATGGTRLHTLAGEYSADYYTMPALLSTAPVYTPIDARAGIEAGPFAGFSAAIEGAYAVNLNLYAGGLYAAWLNEGAPLPGRTYDLRGFQALLRLRYDAGRMFRIEAEGTVSPGSGTKGYFNGYDRARHTARVSAETNPWGRLRLRLEYDFRGHRDIPFHPADGTELLTERLHNLSALNFGVFYGFTESLGIWGRADNLLNRHDAVFPGVPTQGIALSAGISWLF